MKQEYLYYDDVVDLHVIDIHEKNTDPYTLSHPENDRDVTEHAQ